jgi:hypothetical protein
MNELMNWAGGFFMGLASGMLIGYVVSLFIDDDEM